MRVLMLSKACVVGAYQKKLEELSRLPDIQLTVAVPPYWREGRHRLLLERVYTTGYELVALDMRLNGHYHLHFYPGLGDLVHRVRPHLFHIDEEPYNLATCHAMRLGRAAGARCLFFTWQNLYRPQPWNLCERYNLAHASGAIAGSQEAAAVLRRKGFGGTLDVIPQFGVDPDLFRPMPQARQERDAVLGIPTAGTFVIGYLGRLIEAKGLLVLLRAVTGLPGEWRLVLVGDGPLAPQIQALAGELGVLERVSLLPPVPSHAVPQILNCLDCLVLPSLTRSNWKEQFGRVLVEAMACRVPVVGSDSGEIPQVIGQAGLIAREGDPDHLRERLLSLMADSGLRSALAQAGRERVLAQYTQARIAQATHRFYTSLLAA